MVMRSAPKRRSVNSFEREQFLQCDDSCIPVHTLPEQKNSCSHCTGATLETEQKAVRYNVNIASDVLLV